MRIEEGMALRALSANNFLSRFLSLGCCACNFFVEEVRGVLDGEVVVLLVVDLVFDCCFGDFLDLVLDLLRLREISASEAPLSLFCFLDLLRDRERSPTDDADVVFRRLYVVISWVRVDDCVFGRVTSLSLDLDRPLPPTSPSAPTPTRPLLLLLDDLALPLLLCRFGGGGGLPRPWLL